MADGQPGGAEDGRGHLIPGMRPGDGLDPARGCLWGAGLGILLYLVALITIWGAVAGWWD